MTLPQVNEQFEYWLDHPPVHELVAAYTGYKRHSAEILPFTKISPSIGDIPEPERKVAPKPANDLGTLVALAKAKGGEVSLDMLMGLGSN